MSSHWMHMKYVQWRRKIGQPYKLFICVWNDDRACIDKRWCGDNDYYARCVGPSFTRSCRLRCRRDTYGGKRFQTNDTQGVCRDTHMLCVRTFRGKMWKQSVVDTAAAMVSTYGGHRIYDEVVGKCAFILAVDKLWWWRTCDLDFLVLCNFKCE